VEPLLVFFVGPEELDDVDVQIDSFNPYRVGHALPFPDIDSEEVIERQSLVIIRP
jgi:hypothetical protein